MTSERADKWAVDWLEAPEDQQRWLAGELVDLGTVRYRDLAPLSTYPENRHLVIRTHVEFDEGYPSVELAARLEPMHHDNGGVMMLVLKRLDGVVSPEPTIYLCTGRDMTPILELYEEHLPHEARASALFFGEAVLRALCKIPQ